MGQKGIFMEFCIKAHVHKVILRHFESFLCSKMTQNLEIFPLEFFFTCEKSGSSIPREPSSSWRLNW